VIPNFVDLEKFKKQKKEHFKKAICPNGEALVVHTSNFRRVKRVQDVVTVFANLHTEIPSKLLMIGDGPERSKVEAMCRELNIGDAVRFLGKLEAVEEVLSVADLFLMPSEKESFGLAALEAMACEVPVISSDAGGLPELNVQGVTGFLSAVGDVEDMTQKALFVLDKNHLPAFKTNALKRAQEFDISKILPLYENHYQKILEKTASKATI
jgi:N-acetyl-alpha-D-glucosaminyl L-malate synthase BshA